ncbi:hypothetical protein [Novosphingobium pentaromativorans]|uniref:Uncharacterized protein n=1 Tax=Novosphingobium pentaromativorans US6-1 TaxID=1088721 RepID=G6EFG1_9SPHN|nr:hypothetical protein [Novosphingobium pentaromativorans]AIT79134.1 hypothetical protein JI59_04605 [Novosphingobium pentaromativorans US6-1]EHJ60007.1 hypothetical protein NSU_3083 [Novosphingobium pentaromativorans US6-1]
MIRISQHIREGRDAVIAERLHRGVPAINPYAPKTKRGLFWQRGAEQAREAIDQLMRIGA